MPVALHEDSAVYSQAREHRLLCYFLTKCSKLLYGPGSSVGIVTDYGLDGLGIKSR